MYKAKITTIGTVKLGAGLVNLAQIAVGDANGSSYTPTGSETALVNEKYRGSIANQVQSGSSYAITAILPNTTGGYTIREAGLYDIDGDLIYIMNLPERYKPTATEGANVAMTISVVVSVSGSATIDVTVDGAAYVTNAYMQTQFNTFKTGLISDVNQSLNDLENNINSEISNLDTELGNQVTALQNRIESSKIRSLRLISVDDLILSNDQDVKVTASNVTLTLPDATAVTRRLFKIKVAAGCTNVTIITIDGVQTIDGDTSIVLDGLDCLIVCSDGANWDIE